MEPAGARAWLRDAVFYEVYPQSFYDSNGDGIGDLPGITAKLDYIRWLGCNALWINPCFVSPFRDAGYDIADYRHVAPRYGTDEDLVQLFRAAHGKGMRVLLDLVPGHTSDEHPWFRESARPQPNAFTNRYIWTDSAWHVPEHLRCVTGRFDRDGNYVTNFFSSQPALNYGFAHITQPWQLPPDHPDCRATRQAIWEVMCFWLDRGCDGFRVDMADSLVKEDDDKKVTAQLWQELRSLLDQTYPATVLASEWSDPARALACGFDVDFYLDHEDNGYHALFRLRESGTGRDISFFGPGGQGDIGLFTADYLRRYEASRNLGSIGFITGNHDTARLRRFLDETGMKLAFAFLFTMPGVPFLYYGDEIGMQFLEGLVSKEGGYNRTGSRTPMQWTDGVNHGFSQAAPERLYLPVDTRSGAPSVEAQAGDPASLLTTTRTLLQLRHRLPDLQADADLRILYAQPGEYPLLYRRGRHLLGVNPRACPAVAPVEFPGTILFTIGDPPQRLPGRTVMAPRSFVLIDPQL